MLIALLAAFSFSAMVTVALADHYHTYNNVAHGFVHGDSTTDGSMHSRVETLNFGEKHCAVMRYTSQWLAEYVVAGSSATCNTWNHGTGYRECTFSARVEQLSNSLSKHIHYAHGLTGFCP